MRIAFVAVCVIAAGTPLAAQNPPLERNEMRSKTHALVLNAPRDEVFNFLSKVENLPKWAVEFCQGVERRDDQWWVITPQGGLLFRIDADRRTGTLDMYAGPTQEQLQLAPARVVALPDGRSLFLFTAIQYPGMGDEEFEAQCTSLVAHEFPTLKRQVESPNGVPAASAFTSSPLRNRIRIELKAPVSEVWTLLGDLARFPEYSSGLERVEAKRDASGACTEYVCHFKPHEVGGDSVSSREIIRWYEPNRGYASSGDGGNAFGLTNDLNLVTVEASKDGTILTWDEYYDAQDLDMMTTHFDEALADIAKNLVQRFGGKVLERYVDSGAH